MIRLRYEGELGDYVSALKFNDSGSKLAVSMASGCSYIIDVKGKETFKYCYGVSHDISYLNGVFSFVTFNGLVYVVSEEGDLINLFQIGSEYSNAIVHLQEGVLVCNTHCALYTVEGKQVWSVKLNGYIRPGMRNVNGKVYAILERGSQSSLVRIDKDGVEEIYRSEESIFSIDACDRAMAIGSATRLVVINHGRSWEVEGFEGISSVSFSRDCEKVMVADMYNKRVVLLKVGEGNEVEVEEDGLTTAMDWNGMVAVGFNDGRVRIYELMLDDEARIERSVKRASRLRAWREL